MEDAKPRGEAAWKEHRDAVAQRNSDAHRQAQQGKGTKDDAVADRERRQNAMEQTQLEDLNKKIAKGRAGR